jgi:hypothetical protein
LELSTALVGVTSEWLVDSINGITRTSVISEAWVGLILLPIVGNAGLYFPFFNYLNRLNSTFAMFYDFSQKSYCRLSLSYYTLEVK